MCSDRAFTILLLIAAWAVALCGAMRCNAATQTITTTYSYNADGAPTSVTVQTEGGSATTTYLTWYNFTPNSASPSTGTVSAADGNLLGVGPSPGTSGLTTQFAYDARDRLIGCSPSGQSAVSYAYDPVSLMSSSTLASNDSLQFYYDMGSAPEMVNTSQPSTKTVASFLGPVRYLSDGTEQVLLTPRKDTAGVYDATAQTLSPYGYEPYGAPLSSSQPPSGLSSDGTTYDLTQNPFQYGAEYNDPSCNTYYLRARWYLPANQTFLSRDAADALHRFSYTAGNPIGRTDPTGLMYTGGFSHDIDKAVHKLAPGIWAYLEPIMPVWGQVLSSIELLGDLPRFWHHPTVEGGITFGFLAASIATEAGGETKPFDRLFATPQRAFGTRIGIDLVLGASQTAAQADQHGRVDVPALIQGIDTTLFGIFWSRMVGGLGYRPYGLTVKDIDDMSLAHFQDYRNINQALVFRVRSGALTFTSPAMEDLHLGNYHEALFAIDRDTVWKAEVGLGDTEGTYTWVTRWSREAADLNEPSRLLASKPRDVMFVGKFDRAAVSSAIKGEMDAGELASLGATSDATTHDFPNYGKYSNNCQRAAARVRANIFAFQNGAVRSGH